MKKLISFILILWCSRTLAQNAIVTITEQTLKLPGLHEEVFYYCFAQGDQLIFNFQEIDNKELKRIEITEYPSNSRFVAYQTQKIENKALLVPHTGIYVFRFYNGALLKRVCRIRIDRIPADNTTRTFNTSVKWIEKTDTTWKVRSKKIIVGYDTFIVYRSRKQLVKTTFSEDLFMDKNERVHSRMNSNGNQSFVFFTIPTYEPTPLVKTKVVALAYWIGVGKEADKQWELNTLLVKGLAQSVAATFITPLGAYALGAITDLALPSSGEDVQYELVDEQNKALHDVGVPCSIYDKGKGIAGYKKFSDPLLLKGTFYILMSNDNLVQPIDVNIRVSAILQTDSYERSPENRQKVKARYEKRTFKEPVVKLIKVPVIP